MEEAGHDVSVHGFLGSMSYSVDGKIKIVQFWCMRTVGGPIHELTHEINGVKWLPLRKAIDKLSRAPERVFLANVGPIALAKHSLRDKLGKRPVRNKGGAQRRVAIMSRFSLSNGWTSI